MKHGSEHKISLVGSVLLGGRRDDWCRIFALTRKIADSVIAVFPLAFFAEVVVVEFGAIPM